MRTYAVTGAASGIGAAVSARLRAAGHQVIGVDLHRVEVCADLASADGRAAAVAAVAQRASAGLAGLVTCAGRAGLPGRPGALLVRVNYFATVALAAGLRQLLATARGSVVSLHSNATTCQEAAARLADEGDSPRAYPATKTAVARWVRRNAPSWARDGVRLNAVSPGVVDTPMLAEARADPVDAPLLALFPLPVGRVGPADEVAEASDFLLHNHYCGGSVLLIDGGTEALLRPDAWPALWQR